MALAFLGVMGASYIISNPFLLSQWGRTAFVNIFNKQTDLLLEGYGTLYGKGLAAAWPLLQEYYGEAVFILTAIGTAIWGAVRGPRRLLHGLILAWFVPVSVMVLFITHFKFQYWLPVALPLFSSVIMLLPEKWTHLTKLSLTRIIQIGALLVVLVQAFLFLSADIERFIQRTNRAENKPSLQFYAQTVEALKPLQGKPLIVYYDARVYLPPTPDWKTETTFELLEYGYVQEKKFDVLLLMDQRIRDYLQPGAVGIDPAAFARNQQFYRDADLEQLASYQLVYRNPFGLIYVRDIYRDFFKGAPVRQNP